MSFTMESSPSLPGSQGSWLLGAALLLAATHLTLFHASWIPIHDSLYRYQIFHIYYSTFLHQGDLALWLPYSGYGSPAYYYQWAGLSPAALLTGLAGKLAGVTDALLLFKISLLLDGEIYALGLAALACRLFRHPWSRLLLIGGGILSLCWWYQPYFGLYVFYGLPWVLWLVQGYFREGDLRWLIGAALVELITLQGSLPYIAPVHFWIVVLFSLPLLWRQPGLVRRALQSCAVYKIPLLFLVVLALLTGYFALHATEGMVNLAVGRNADTGRVPLQFFLDYGSIPVVTALFGWFSGGWVVEDVSFYLGWLPWLLLAVGLLVKTTTTFHGSGLVIVWLIGLAMGGWGAIAIYHLPGMDLFRHIGYLYATLGLFVLLAAAAVLDGPLLRGSSRSLWSSLAVVALLLLDGLVHNGPGEAQLFATTPQPGWDVWLWPRLAAYGAALALAWLTRNRPQIPVRFWLVAAFLVDIGVFQLFLQRSFPWSSPPPDAAMFQADPLPFLAQRTPFAGPRLTVPPGYPEQAARLYYDRPKGRELLPVLFYTFARMDPCVPWGRQELMLPAVLSMIEARGGKIVTGGEPPAAGSVLTTLTIGGLNFHVLQPGAGALVVRIFPPDFFPATPGFHRWLGCGSDKLTLFPTARSFDTFEAARHRFAHVDDPSRELVLMERQPAAVVPEGSTPPGQKVTPISFSANHLEVALAIPEGAPWILTYADGWHAGWRARLDGQPVAILPAQLGFKAVRVPPGEHHLRLRFEGGVMGVLARVLAILGALAVLLGMPALVVHALAGSRGPSWSPGGFFPGASPRTPPRALPLDPTRGNDSHWTPQ